MTQPVKTVEALRRSVAQIDGRQERLSIQSDNAQLTFGIKDIDSLIGCGLALDDMHELRCSQSRDLACMAGFLLGLLLRLNTQRPVICISEPSARLDTGRIFPDGASYFGFDTSRLVHITPIHLKDAFWATGEAVRSGGSAAVMFHLKGNPQSFDLSISRKLMLRAQTSGTPLFIVRQAGEEETSSASTRWHIKPETSLPDQAFTKGVGQMRLTLTLEKNRNGQLGRWPIAWNPQTRSFNHVKESPDTTHSVLPVHSSAYRPHRSSETGKFVASG